MLTIARARWTLTLALVVWLFSGAPAQAGPLTFSFSLLPADGEISGEPGSTIGWGYTIVNDSDSWLELIGLTAGGFEHAMADASLFDFPYVAPGATRTVAYDPSVFAGLFQITWDTDAPLGFTNIGEFVLSGWFWDADPQLGGAAFVDFAPDQTAPYVATVTSATPVPEPATLLLTAGGAVGLFLRRRRVTTHPSTPAPGQGVPRVVRAQRRR